MQFHIVIPMYNAEKWIEANLKIIRNQKHLEFSCVIIDDCSEDKSVEKARKIIQDDDRFKILLNHEKRFALGSAVKGIQSLDATDDDVVLIVDADDSLYDLQVLNRLNRIYSERNCLMTYGSYCDQNGLIDKVCRPFPIEVAKTGKFRKCQWLPVHLRTFKYRMWHRIKPDAFTISAQELKKTKLKAFLLGHLRAWVNWLKIRTTDLLDPSECFVRRCCDKALMYPLLEMAGDRSFFVKEPLYIFNSYEKTLQYGSKATQQKWFTRCIRNVIWSKPRYKMLTD